jgi:hypothetical protein
MSSMRSALHTRWGVMLYLITQSAVDIPFDLRHLRYVEYMNNEEERRTLHERLVQRLQDLWADAEQSVAANGPLRGPPPNRNIRQTHHDA